MVRFVRILTVFLWVAATLFVVMLFAGGLSFEFLVGLLGRERLETLEAVLVGTVALCSGLIARGTSSGPTTPRRPSTGSGRGRRRSTPPSWASPFFCPSCTSR
jgi:hypothetical protein